MVKAKELSIDLRLNIIDLHKAGNSYGDIYKRLDTPRSTVQSFIKKFAQFRTTEILLGRGWKRKLSAKSDQKQFREININPRMVLDNYAKRLETEGTSVSKRTIQRCLNKNVVHGYRRRLTPLPKPCHVATRMSFVK